MVVAITADTVARIVAFLAVVRTSLTSLSEVLLKISQRTSIYTGFTINKEVSRYTSYAECLKCTEETSWITKWTKISLIIKVPSICDTAWGDQGKNTVLSRITTQALSITFAG